MFDKGDKVAVFIDDDFLTGTIVQQNEDETYLVRLEDGTTRSVSEFDIVPDDLDEDFISWDEDDDLSDLDDLFRNVNQSYY